MMIRLSSLAVLLLIAGCGSYSPPGTAEYKSGYFDGCMQGFALSAPYHVERDEQQYMDDAEYRTGWHEGYTKCADDTLSGTAGESWHP